MRFQVLTQRERGFTLVEMSIVMTLMAVFLIAALDMVKSKMEQDRAAITRARMETIMQALENYVRQYGRVPCPSNPEGYPNDDTWNAGGQWGNAQIGFEATNIPNNGAGSACSLDANDLLEYTGGTPTVFGGILPFHTLNLPETYSIDAWGNRFTYMMDQNMADPAKFISPADAVTEGSIEMRNIGGQALEAFPGNGTKAAFVLISHGQNGYGAWPVIFSCCGNAVRHGTTTAHSTEITNSQPQGGIAFLGWGGGVVDDIVMYRAKWQLPCKKGVCQ